MKISRQLLFAAALFASAFACFAQEASPFFPVLNDGILPTNAVVSEAPMSPGFPSQRTPSASPAPSVDFSGLGDLGTFFPPDTHGAVGASNVVTTLNTQVRIQTRTGTVVDTTSLSNFWSSVGPFSTVSDPRVIYDPFYKRWIATAIVEPFLGSASLVIGVSKSENPAFTNWYRYRFDADASNIAFADQPAIGFNKDWIVAQANMISNAILNGARGTRIWVFTKANLYAGGNEIPRAATFTNIGLSQIPAVTLDTNTATLYLVQDFLGHFTNAQQVVNGYLSIYTVTGTIGSESFSQTPNFPAAGPWAQAPFEIDRNNIDTAPQTNSTTVKIRNNDSRISNVAVRNGSIWCAHTIFLPYTNTAPRSSVQWWQISTNGEVQQQGRIDDSSGVNFYAFPSVAVNRFNDALIGYSSFSTNQYASASYSVRDFSANGLNELQLPRTFKAGTDVYWRQPSSSAVNNRWGDYSAAVVDPLNDIDFWTIQEYATNHVGTVTNGSGRWATWWAKVSPTVPGNDNFASSYQVSGSSGTTNGNNIRATEESGEPNHAGDAGTASVWYHWTPPSAGNVIIDTIGSDYSMILAVYTGSSVGALTLVTNDTGIRDTAAEPSAVPGPKRDLHRSSSRQSQSGLPVAF
jgi:hypothetical protein